MSIFKAFSTILFILCSALPVLAEPTVNDVRLGKQGPSTRLVIELDQKVQFTVFTLDAPYRVVIDLPAVSWRLMPNQGEQSLGVVDKFRYGLFKEDTSRIVIDLNEPVEVENAFIFVGPANSNSRVVIDLLPVSRDKFVADLPPQSTLTQQTKIQDVIIRPYGKIVVAIDPGHGGVDPGAIGVRGVQEKSVTLLASLELKSALEKAGNYQVVMTRNSDKFVPLRRRVEIAREAGAELFLSIHADSIKDNHVRGASVYTLSEKSSDKEAATLAARENRADAIGGLNLHSEEDDIAKILINLSQRESMNASARFANLLIPEISKNWLLLRNTHRFSGFVVLKAPDVPSVLVELGFLSNRHDESQLSSLEKRKPIVDAIVRAVNKYFER